MTGTAMLAEPIAAAVGKLLAASSLWLGSLALLALLLGAWLLRHRAAARHGLLLATLLLGALAPLSLAVAPGVARMQDLSWVSQPRGLARELFDAPSPSAPSPRADVAPSARAAGAPLTSGWEIAVGLWAVGLLVSLGRLLHGLWRTDRLRRAAVPWPREHGSGHPLAELDGKPFRLFVSDELQTAAVVGFRRPVILVGRALLSAPALSVRQVLLHEAAHARRRDPLWGLFERLVQVVYWFHPAVFVLRAALARAREEACDDRVLRWFAPADYARTLLALAACPGVERSSPFASAFGPLGAASVQTAIARRIQRLLSGPAPRRRWRLRAAGAAATLVVPAVWLTVVLSPVAGAMPAAAEPERLASVSPPPASDRAAALGSDHDPIFGSATTPGGPPVAGAFVLQDLQRGTIVVVNQALAHQRVTPASTFKVIIAAAGLEDGQIPDNRTPRRWDGRPQPLAEWNQDQTLASAMRLSTTWYFQEVLAAVDRPRLRTLMRSLGYGNLDTGGDWRSFWIDGNLRVSPLEQAQAMARLVEGAVPLGDRTRALLDEVTELGRRDDAVLYGKTGTAESPEQTVAWLVGYVRRGPRRFAYATLMVSPGGDSARLRSTRRSITEALLVRHGALPGPTEVAR